MSSTIQSSREQHRVGLLGEEFHRLHERLSDPLLTTLTLLLSILLFVMGPLQAAGVVTGRHVGFFFGVVLVPAAFLVSASRIAIASNLVAISLVIAAAVLEMRQSASIDLYLDAAAYPATLLALLVTLEVAHERN